MELFLIIGGIGAFLYLHMRVSDLERRLASRDSEQAPPSTQPTQPLVTAPVNDQVAPVPPPGYYDAPVISTPSAPAEQTTFDEETGGRWLGRVGIAAIFIGIAFFLKYAFDTNLITIVGRVVLGVIAGGIFIGAGQYLRQKYAAYAYLLVGGGVAVLYLSFYVAFALYQLVSQPVAFMLMILVTAGTIVLSIIDDSEPLAVLAVLGGFATPYLIASGQNDPLSLFTYVTILNIVALVVAMRKDWVVLTYLSFVGTGFHFVIWYAKYYSPDQLSVALTFLSIFFAIYLGLPLVRNFMGVGQMSGDDLALVTVNAFGYFSVAYFLLNPTQHDILWVVALLLGAVYYMLAYVIHSRGKADAWTAQYYAGIATIFVTLAIPLKLDHSWITLAWLAEAALLYVIAFRNAYASLKAYAAGAYVLGVSKLFFDCALSGSLHQTPFFNEYVALFLVAIAVAYTASYLYHHYGTNEGGSDAVIASTFFVVANVLSIYMLTSQVSAVYNDQMQGYLGQYGYGNTTDLANQRNTAVSIVWSAYSILLIIVGFGAKLRIARILGLVFSFFTAWIIFIEVWSFGDVYRIIASIVFGSVALLGSFLYVRYSQRIKALLQ